MNPETNPEIKSQVLGEELKKWPHQIGVGDCRISPRQRRYITKVLDSNRLTYGPMSQQFEAEFAKTHGKRFAVFCNSGTSALHICLAILKEREGWENRDEVIIPALTFVADLNVVLHNQLKPVFVDVHPQYYTLDVEKLEQAITPRTRAIIPVHTFGLPAEMEPIMQLAQRHGIKVIEDVCESGFVSYRGKPVGSIGDLSCFSTYQAHLITTGVGGLTLTDDPDLAALVRSMVNHGRDSIYLKMDDDQGQSEGKFREIIERRFNFVRLGHSFRATELEAALGLAALHDGMKEVIVKRNQIARYFISKLEPYAEYLQLPTVPSYSEHAFMMFPLVVRGDRFRRDELVQYLEEHNIETRYMLPLINQPYVLERFGDLGFKYPVSSRVNQNGFYIGCHDHLTQKEMDFVMAVFAQFFTERG